MKNLIGTMAKRGFAFTLALVMCVSLLPTVSLAAEGDEEGAEPNITVVTVPETPKEVSSTETNKTSDTPSDTPKEVSVTAGETDNNADKNDVDADETNDKAKETKEADAKADDNATEDGDAPKEDEPAEPTEGDTTDAETPGQDDETWDITKTQRPEASETVTEGTGDVDAENEEVPIFSEADPAFWDVFYDAENDVYKVTFKIGADAQGNQTVDLTKALELLTKYSKTGKTELQKRIDELEMPKKEELPSNPSKPEGLDEKTQVAFDKFAEMAATDPNSSTVENAKTYLAAQGLDVSDKFVKEYAEYMMYSADLKQVVADYNSGNLPSYLKNKDLGYILKYYTSVGKKVEWTGGKLNVGEPYVPAPDFPVDMNTQAGQEYAAKKAEIEKKYADDKAAYANAIEELQKEFDRRIEANILQPGDVKKFELTFASDSKHTYKYLDGSFTLATPEWPVDSSDPETGTIGFDGQVLPDQYVDHSKYYIPLASEPIQALLKGIWDTHPEVQKHAVQNKFFDNKIMNYDDYYWDAPIKDVLKGYAGDSLKEQLNSYILKYYENKYDKEYTTIDELIQTNPDACNDLTNTESIGEGYFHVRSWYNNFLLDARTEAVKYNTYYKRLFSFAFGDKADIDQFLGEGALNDGTNRWEYENNSWTSDSNPTDAQKALYYYMDHQEIWEQTNTYFNTLLKEGLSEEQATWTSLMMAMNVDGSLTDNSWQLTKWQGYSSLQLEQMDIDFTLSKKDQAGETITSSDTEFQVYYIDKVKNEDGTETNVNMYCTYDENTNAYTFVTTPSTVWTKDGELNISYAMMKDVVYYLQEKTAPQGYELDTNVYIVMSEEDYDQLTDEDKANLGEFNEFLNTTTSDDGLTVNADFVNVKIVTPGPKPSHDPDPKPDPTPDPTPTPDPNPDPPVVDIPEEDPPLVDIPEEDPPLVDIPEEDPPLVDIPEEDPPLADVPQVRPQPPQVTIPDGQPPLVDIPEEEVPLADVPKTGDLSHGWYLALLLSACALPTLALLKKREQDA